MKQILKKIIKKYFFKLYVIKQFLPFIRGLRAFKETSLISDYGNSDRVENELRTFFEMKNEGRGIWKWDHYFDIYERHFSRFKGKRINILEIGIYSGGSIEMWMNYFGSNCTFYGVDIEDACKVYESKNVHIYIGDQQDRAFWKRIKQKCPKFDVVIDDGGHQALQQITTLEEVMEHINPGGVYLCEDIHHDLNTFSFFAGGLVHQLNAFSPVSDHNNPLRRLSSRASNFQNAISSISFYPFVTVIEKNRVAVGEFIAGKRGTQWQPFLK